MIRYALATITLALAAQTNATSPPVVEWTLPLYTDAMEPVEVTARVSSGLPANAQARYRYPDGTEGTIPLTQDKDGNTTYRIPGAHNPQVGKLVTYLQFGDIETSPGVIPLAYVEELDITGDPPVVLPYELGHESYLVRYIPCCNIFGGVMIAHRLPVNPMDNADGLPATLHSDFVDLEPDDLTASTAGTYMRMGFDSTLDAGTIALYTWSWKSKDWSEVLSYEVDPETSRVDFHCPEGGIFVLGEKTN